MIATQIRNITDKDDYIHHVLTPTVLLNYNNIIWQITVTSTSSVVSPSATTEAYHRFAPPYQSDDCQLVTDVGRRHLRSADVHTCTVPRTQSRLGDLSFWVAGPRLWNSLPALNCDSKTFASPSLGGYLYKTFCSLRLGAL